MEEQPKSPLAHLLRLLGLKGAQGRLLQGALLLGVAGLTLLLMAGPMGLSRPALPVVSDPPLPPASGPGELATYEDDLARRLEGILAHVAGVGQVRVHLTLAAGPAKVVQVDQKRTTRTTQEKDPSGGTRQVSEAEESGQMVMTRGGGGPDAPVVLQVQRPEVAGVLVVAEGAGDARVRAELTRAVAVTLGIPFHHIRVEEGR